MKEINWEQLDQYIIHKMDEENIAGVSIGISANGKTIFQKGYGYRSIEEGLPVTPETIFGIASVTKSYTAMAILELEEKGFLSVEDPVNKYLPELTIKGIKDMSSIKIHHLLSHSTGLAPMERNEHLNQFNEHLSYLEIAENNILGNPGEYFSYCNDTFLLLGAIIERVTSQLFRRYMTTRILDRLGMNRSTFSLEELMKMDNVSVPYEYNRKSNRLENVEWPMLGNYEVGGGVRSNVVDLLKYGQIYVNGHNSYTNNMWKPVIQVGRNTYYGYALNVTSNYAGEFTMVSHGGGQPGVSSHFGFIPEEKLVVTVLTNVGGVSVGDIWLAAVNTALGLPIELKLCDEPFYDMPSGEYQKFEGIYTSKEGGNIRIYSENEGLYAEMEGQTLELRASGPDTLVLINKDKPFRFHFQPNEKAWALFNGSRMLLREE